ncbi:MAG: phosphatidylglycerophosphatase A [Pseudomonadota bacterium]
MVRRVSIREVFCDPVHLLAFGFGTGLSPKAPGTVGTLVGILIQLNYMWFEVGFELRVVIVVAIALSGVWLCGQSAKRLGVHDHPGIVWDEIAGFLLAVLFVPDQWAWIVAAFVLFRFFDIAKPWPIGPVDKKVSGGLGIMLDDILAGGFTVIALGLIQLFLG